MAVVSLEDLMVEGLEEILTGNSTVNIKLPYGGKIQIKYDNEGNIERIKDADGNKIYIEEADNVIEIITGAIVNSWSDVPNMGKGCKKGKFCMEDGTVHDVEFDDNGVLRKEKTPNYEVYYLANNLEYASALITERLSKLMNDSFIQMREVVDEDGKTYIEEAILGAIVSRTEVTEE